MQIAADAHVTLRYAVSIDGDPAPDCAADGQVTEFILGRGQVLPGIEAKLAGQADGAKLDFTLAPSEAFGEVDPSLDLRIPLSEFPAGAEEHLKPGARFRGPHPADPSRVMLYTVQERVGDQIAASGNHPLAGKSLRVSAEVLSVREATEDELSGGCGSGGCGSGGCGSGSCGEGSCGSGSCGSHEGHDHEHGHSHEHSDGGCCGHQH